MIEINLLPDEFKVKEEKLVVLQLRQVFLFAVPALFGLLIVLHLYLGGLLLFRSLQYKLLYKKWTQVSLERKRVNEWKRQYNISSKQTEQMDRLLAQRITVSDKMQILSQALPYGIWFNHLNLKHNEFRLRGSVVSKRKDQLHLLNIFLKRLKEDKTFFKDFTRLELGHMSMRMLGGFSVMDFVLEGSLK